MSIARHNLSRFRTQDVSISALAGREGGGNEGTKGEEHRIVTFLFASSIVSAGTTRNIITYMCGCLCCGRDEASDSLVWCVCCRDERKDKVLKTTYDSIETSLQLCKFLLTSSLDFLVTKLTDRTRAVRSHFLWTFDDHRTEDLSKARSSRR